MAVYSPGDWVAPTGSLPGWNWLPEDYGVRPALERIPRWVRAWFRTPFVDRYAYAWMWNHGGLELLPSAEGPGSSGSDHVPVEPVPPSPLVASTPDATVSEAASSR